ncbi:MAG TPA: hypothetical protein VNE41_12615 [Chitinophagaceae bacterium]|nr:hypothetical protein [Chitinophagaceae bacterium]
MRSAIRTLVGLAVFSIAMGYLESAVVVYLRLLYYPAGFRFPLAQIPSQVATIEFFRELATIIMLAGIAGFAGKNRTRRFAYFLYCFGIWDLCYYIFLKLLVGWPSSLFDWDILFLIPLPWVGPVIAPCLVSLTMIGYTVTVTWLHEKIPVLTITRRERSLITAGSLVIIASFLWDYIRYIRSERTAGLIWSPGNRGALFSGMARYIPAGFDWGIFWLGEVLILLAVAMMIFRGSGTDRKDRQVYKGIKNRDG